MKNNRIHLRTTVHEGREDCDYYIETRSDISDRLFLVEEFRWSHRQAESLRNSYLLCRYGRDNEAGIRPQEKC